MLSVAKLLRQQKNADRLVTFVEKNGYCEEYYQRLEKKLCHGRKNTKIRKKLRYTVELCKGNQFEKALEIIGSINTNSVSKKLLKNYYGSYCYVLAMSRNFKDAKMLHSSFEETLSKTYEGCFASGIVLFESENFKKASKSFEKAIGKSKNRLERNSATMYYSLALVKLGQKELAKEIVGNLTYQIIEPSQSEDLKKLMKIIEGAFGFNSEFQSENTDDVAEKIDEELKQGDLQELCRTH